MNSERLFGNMARPSGVLSAPGEINDVTAKRLKTEFEANYSQGNIGRTAVLGDGLEWKPMTLTGVEAQLIEQLKWTIEDVARVFRVPMYLLNDTARMTYKNSEHAAQAYYSGCLQYHAESTEARFTNDFGFDETSKRVEFDVAGMFRMDTKERFEAYNAGITGGHLSPNEAREMEGRGPVKGGEEPRMQMQYVPLSTPVADPTADAPAPAPAAEQPEDDEKAMSETAHAEMLAIIARMAGGAGRIQQCREGMTQ
jgi:HK97 family phage portal protein